MAGESLNQWVQFQAAFSNGRAQLHPWYLYHQHVRRGRSSVQKEKAPFWFLKRGIGWALWGLCLLLRSGSLGRLHSGSVCLGLAGFLLSRCLILWGWICLLLWFACNDRLGLRGFWMRRWMLVCLCFGLCLFVRSFFLIQPGFLVILVFGVYFEHSSELLFCVC